MPSMPQFLCHALVSAATAQGMSLDHLTMVAREAYILGASRL